MADLPLKKEFVSTIFRIVQETSTNIIRHSKASESDITISVKDKLFRISVKDNGIGFDIEKEKGRSKLGLFGIEERAKPWNGKLTIISEKDKGSELIVDFSMDTLS